jgi:hypothetical protein
MSNVEQIQQATKDFGEAATASAHTFASSLQAVTNAHADFAKKLMEHGSEFISQLTSVKEPAKLMERRNDSFWGLDPQQSEILPPKAKPPTGRHFAQCPAGGLKRP